MHSKRAPALLTSLSLEAPARYIRVEMSASVFTPNHQQRSLSSSHTLHVCVSTHGPTCLDAGCTSKLCFPGGMGQSHTLCYLTSSTSKYSKPWSSLPGTCHLTYSLTLSLGLRDSLSTPCYTASKGSSASPSWAEGLALILSRTLLVSSSG